MNVPGTVEGATDAEVKKTESALGLRRQGDAELSLCVCIFACVPVVLNGGEFGSWTHVAMI